jgi:hypothetical protein
MDLNLAEWIPALIIGILLIAVVWWKFAQDLRFRFRGVITEGRIVNWMSATEKGRRYFYPLIEFTTESGKQITYRAEERCENEPLYEPGTPVKVRYLPADPRRVKTIYP